MAEVAAAPSALAGLEEELSCSICLCLFESPVTTPCGHNFCLPCLEMTWGAAAAAPSPAGRLDNGGGRCFACPQCRSIFDGRPELKKNTVLCRVVEQFRATEAAKAAEAPPAPAPPPGQQRGRQDGAPLGAPPPAPSVACDSCLEAEAARTCLTCMASFCAPHLRPHLESPAFQGHQLVPPVRALQLRKCPQHHKLLEFFCHEHGACVCCLCLAAHKACATVPLPEAKRAKELQLKKRLTELYALSEKAAQGVDQVIAHQKQNSDTVYRKLELLKSEFLEIIALVQEEEKESVKKVTSEEKRVYDKYEFVSKVLCKKKSEIRDEKNQIEMALTEDDDIAFLEKTAKLRPVTFKDVFIPKMELNQNLIHTVYQNAFHLKENVKQFLTQPQEKKTEESASLKPKLQAQPGKKNVASNAPKEGDSSSVPSEKTTTENPTNPPDTKQKRRAAKREPNPNQRARSCSTNRPQFQPVSLETFLKKSREQLLEFATQFTLDYHTAHRKVILSERNTKISVSEAPQNYPNHPQRFTYCSQVVSFQCVKRGIHYWEAEIENSNFCAIGICYGSMPRSGAESRLGRNSSSWCVEWFNTRISAWHNDVEKRLPNTKVKKIGVLLNYDDGFMIFFGIAEKVTLLYKYRAQFTEAIYAAFWIFSSGTTISICKLN